MFRLLHYWLATVGLVALALTLTACNSGPSAAGPSYLLSASSLNPSTVTAGNPASSTITLTPANSYSGSVTLSCSSVTGGTPPPACSFSNSPVALSGTAPATSTLTVSTTQDTPGGPYAIVVAASDAKSLPPSDGAQTQLCTRTP